MGRVSSTGDAVMADYVAELSEKEVDGILAVVSRADSRRKDTRIARRALGIQDSEE